VELFGFAKDFLIYRIQMSKGEYVYLFMCKWAKIRKQMIFYAYKYIKLAKIDKNT